MSALPQVDQHTAELKRTRVSPELQRQGQSRDTTSPTDVAARRHPDRRIVLAAGTICRAVSDHLVHGNPDYVQALASKLVID